MWPHTKWKLWPKSSVFIIWKLGPQFMNLTCCISFLPSYRVKLGFKCSVLFSRLEFFCKLQIFEFLLYLNFLHISFMFNLYSLWAHNRIYECKPQFECLRSRAHKWFINWVLKNLLLSCAAYGRTKSSLGPIPKSPLKWEYRNCIFTWGALWLWASQKLLCGH